MEQELWIRGVRPAGCLDHADIVLIEDGATEEIRVRVDAAAGRAVLAELQRLPCESAVMIDILRAVLAAQHAALSCVTVTRGPEGTGAIHFSSAEGSTGIRGLPVGTPLVIAARLGLPVRITPAETAPENGRPLPGAIQAFIDELSLEAFGTD